MEGAKKYVIGGKENFFDAASKIILAEASRNVLGVDNDKEEGSSVDVPPTKSRRALWRFRALVRMVMKNVPWLNEEVHGLSKNVHKNVRLLTAKTLTSILKLKTKSLLLKPPEKRTPEEVGIIFKAIGQLKALRSYPESVVMQLAACATYRYYEAGRMILRQDHPPMALYFVVTGELKVYVKQPFEDNPSPTATIRMGEMFGEIALINELNRGGTVISATPVELLMIDGEDFKSVLKESFKGKQGYVLNYLESMSYFNDWDYQTRLNTSLLCHCEKFKKFQTILGDSDKRERYVYFVISGVCKLIENMNLEVRYSKTGRETYKPHISDTPPPLVRFSETFSRFFLKDDEDDEDDDEPNTKRKKSRSISKNKPESSFASASKISKKSMDMDRSRSSGSSKTNSSNSSYKDFAQRYSLRQFGPSISNLKVIKDYHVKTVFMEIATFTEKACFCVGENMRNRRIIAGTDVECLLLPHSFIVDGPNPMVWKHIRMFLNKVIPSTEEILKEFKRQKSWRERILRNIKLHSRMRNLNNIHNVPYSIRVVDDFVFE